MKMLYGSHEHADFFFVSTHFKVTAMLGKCLG
jgi:hypothetical protein